MRAIDEGHWVSPRTNIIGNEFFVKNLDGFKDKTVHPVDLDW